MQIRTFKIKSKNMCNDVKEMLELNASQKLFSVL